MTATGRPASRPSGFLVAAARVDLGGPGQRRLGVDAQEGLDPAVVLVDLIEIGLGQLDGSEPGPRSSWAKQFDGDFGAASDMAYSPSTAGTR